MVQGGFSTDSSSGTSRRITTADQMAAYEASWMHPSPERPHVMQRVAERAATAAGSTATALRQQQDLQHVIAPAVDDTADPLSRGLQSASEADAAWGATYRRAADKRLPRSLRVLGWQLLHAALMTGDNRVYAAANMTELLQCCCQHPQCQPQEQPEQPHDSPQQEPSQPPSQLQQRQQPQQPGGRLQQQQVLSGGTQPQQQQRQQHSGLQQSQPRQHSRGTQSQQQQQSSRGAQLQQQQHSGAQQSPGQPQQQQQPAGALLLGSPAPDSYQLETLTHLFVQCPIAVAVWAWFARVWSQVQPDAAVDFSSARVLLLDDSAAWRPPQPLCQLWTYLRLLMLESIWVVRCASNGRPFTSTAILTRFRTALQQQLSQDWLRSQGDIRLDCGVPMSWLRGRNPVLSAAKFEAKWQHQGLLYTVADGQGARLVLPGWET
jgi:hypothetical protein